MLDRNHTRSENVVRGKEKYMYTVHRQSAVSPVHFVKPVINCLKRSACNDLSIVVPVTT